MSTFNVYRIALAAVVFLGTAQAAADEYDFELGLAYANQRAERLSAVGAGPDGPLPGFGAVHSDTDADRYTLLGTWYYSGLHEVDGPRARAAFLGRTSSLSLLYEYGEETTDWNRSGTTPPAPSQPPASGTSDTDKTTIEARLRHVWADSGWYAIVGASRLEVDEEVYDRGGDRWEAGLGKYLASATALDLRIVEDEVTGIDRTLYGLNFSHVGALPGGWQYGSDLGIGYSDDDGDYQNYGIALSLFPTNDIEFGLTYDNTEYYESTDEDIGGFASWFIREDIEVRARYTSHELPDREGLYEHDDDSFDIGVNVRF